MTGVAKGETGSFWLDQIAPASDKPVTVCPPAQCDICIIGCGITGAALAYYLSRPNSLDPEAQKPSIVVLEARSIAGGATGRNGGILWPDSSDEFEVGGQAVVHDFISEHKVDCGWNAAGGISLVGNPLLTKVSEGLDADQARDDDPHERDLLDGLTQVDPEQILHAAPHTFRTGYKDDKVVSFWPAKVTAALAQLAIAAGVVVCEHCEVSSVGKSRKADGLVPIASSKGTVHGRTVIVATNGWIPRLLPELQPHIRPCTNTVLSSAEAVPPHLRWPVAAISCGAGSHEVYASVTRNGILILGGLRDSGEEWSGDNDQAAGDPKVVHALGKWYEIVRRLPLGVRC